MLIVGRGQSVKPFKMMTFKEGTTHKTGKITPRHKTHHHDQTTDALTMEFTGQT